MPPRKIRAVFRPKIRPQMETVDRTSILRSGMNKKELKEFGLSALTLCTIYGLSPKNMRSLGFGLREIGRFFQTRELRSAFSQKEIETAAINKWILSLEHHTHQIHTKR